jgi:UDP-N-acetyl-D-glucosamine dehydrogenase
VRGARILVLGVAYKAGVADTRESPAVKLIRLLRDRGADVVYHDPHVPELSGLGLRGEPDLARALEGVDLAVIVTAHPGVDHERVMDEAPRTLDLRGITRGAANGRVRRL